MSYLVLNTGIPSFRNLLKPFSRYSGVCIVRHLNALGMGCSENPAAFPRPEYIPGVGNGKDYGFPEVHHGGPSFWPRDPRLFYRRSKPDEGGVWIIGTAFWFYIFWNIYANPQDLIGEPELYLPNPDLWTDEELGIPPLEE